MSMTPEQTLLVKKLDVAYKLLMSQIEASNTVLVKELRFACSQLRHANLQLQNGTVKDQKQFADGLIAPQVVLLEHLITAIEALQTTL